jgi:hypothetical protein
MRALDIVETLRKKAAGPQARRRPDAGEPLEVGRACAGIVETEGSVRASRL